MTIPATCHDSQAQRQGTQVAAIRNRVMRKGSDWRASAFVGHESADGRHCPTVETGCGVSSDDVFIAVAPVINENFSFGRGIAEWLMGNMAQKLSRAGCLLVRVPAAEAKPPIFPQGVSPCR